MLTNTELERRQGNSGAGLATDLIGVASDSHGSRGAQRRASRLNRNRRLAEQNYRRPGGWSVGLW